MNFKFWGVLSITNVDNLGVINEGPGGPLYNFLTKDYDKANPPILIINSEQFDTDDLVQHNSLFDDKPKVDGTALPEGTIVILLRNSSKSNFILGEDLTSRIDVIEDCPVPDKTLYQAYPPLSSKPVSSVSPTTKIDLFHSESWENLLLGQWIIKGNSLYFEEGLLQEAFKKHTVISLKNGLWESPSFQHFWQEALQKGSIDYEGQHIDLPKDFDLVIEEGYDWEQLSKAVEFKDGINFKANCLNPNLFNSFFFEYEPIESSKGMKKIPGLIQRAAGKELIINLTRALDDNDWARLLSECKIHKVKLVCHSTPGVELPASLQHKYQAEEDQKKIPFYTNPSPCMVIKSSDRDTTVAQLAEKRPENVFIDVSELESFDLLEQVQGHYDNTTHQFQFTRLEKIVNKALKENKNVILTGQCSNTLLDALMPLLLSRANNPKAKVTLALIVDDNCAYNFPYFSQHDVSKDEKIAALKIKHPQELIDRLRPEQLDKDSLSQLKARLRYLKKHPLEEDSSKAWEGLLSLSTHIQLAPFDLEDSEEKARATIKQLIDDIGSSLSESPILYLSGLTGVGKTTFIEKHFGKEAHVTLYNGEEHLKNWAEDKSDKLKVLFIDEANINQRQWSEFEGLFKDPPSIVINGQLHWLNKDHSHVVVFAGNPLNYGNDRQLATLFKRHGNAKVFEPMTGEFIYEMILKPLFEESDVQGRAKEIAEKVLGLYRYLVNLSTNEVLISARELQLIILLILAAHHRDKHQDLARITAHYIYQIGSTIVPYEHKKDFDVLFKPTELLYPKQVSSFKLENSNYLITPSRQEIYQLILDLLQLRVYRKRAAHNDAQKFAGISSLILEGEPGIGKSKLVRAILQEYLFEEATLNEKPDSENIFYQIPIGMRNEQKKILFRKGLADAAALIIDEMNSAPMMERWQNDLLMNKDPVTKSYPAKPGAILFGTQNPVTMAGRQKPSNAVKRRVLHYSLPNYPPEEMEAILVNDGCSVADAKNMVRVYVYLVDYARKNYLSPAPTFRDLLRLARISSKLEQIEALNTFYASVDKQSLRQSLIKAEANFDSETVLALAKYLTPKTVHIFDLHIRLFNNLILKNMTERKVEFLLNFLTFIMPEHGEIDEKNIQYFNTLCDVKIEQVLHFEKLNDIFARNPSLMDAIFKLAKTPDFFSLANLIVEYSDLSGLLSSLLSKSDAESLSFCREDFKPSLEFIRTYISHYPEVQIATQLALAQIHHFLLEQDLESKVSWETALLKINHEKVIKIHELISSTDKTSHTQLFHSMFNDSLLKELKNDEKVAYIKLMIEDEPTRNLFQLDKAVFSKVNLVRKYMAKFKTASSQEVIDMIDQFQDYPELVDHLFSNETSQAELFSMCKANPKYYVDFVKAYIEKHLETTPISKIKLLELYQLINQYAPQELTQWTNILLDSAPEQITKLHSLFSSKVHNRKALTQCMALYHYLNTEASADHAIWHSILQEASSEELNKMQDWMSRYQQHNKLEFLNLVYARAHARDLYEDSLFKYLNKLLNQSVMNLFDFNKPFKFNAERVQLLHHLENKTFVTSGTSTFKNLWTELKNSTLLNAIYDAYLQFFGQKSQDKETLLLVAKELTAVPKAGYTGKLEQNVVSDLSGVVNNYLHSFWIRTQRKNSARALLQNINNHYNDYAKLLNCIQDTRNEVFTNDTEKERHMHRFGSSRYYQTLNQLEEVLISHWIKDKTALSNFQVYLKHYETTLLESPKFFVK